VYRTEWTHVSGSKKSDRMVPYWGMKYTEVMLSTFIISKLG